MAKQSTKTTTPATTVDAAAAAAPAAVAAVKAPKAPKAAKAPKVEASASAPMTEATATAAAPSAKAAKAAKAPRQPKASKAAAAAAAAAAAPAAPAAASDASAPSAEASVAVDTASVSTEFTDFLAKLQQLSTVVSSLKTEFRALEKKATRELKTAAKASHKRKRKTGNRSPSGFVKPTLISDELASFLGKTKGTEMARTEVTREINAYIRANQLQDKSNGRRINADSKLSSLLKLASGEELTYFNLQRYMSPHFAKTSAAAAVPL